MRRSITVVVATSLCIGALHSVTIPFHRLVKGELYPIPKFEDIDIVKNTKVKLDPLDVLGLKTKEATELFFEGKVTKGVEPVTKKTRPTLAQYYKVINEMAAAILASTTEDIKKYFNDKEKFSALAEDMKNTWDGLARHKLLRNEMYRFSLGRIGLCFRSKQIPYESIYPLFGFKESAKEDIRAFTGIKDLSQPFDPSKIQWWPKK